MAPRGKATAAQLKGALPDFIPPQLAVLIDKPPAGDAWLHEIKLDGYRTAARIEAGKARMLTRKGLDWTERFAPVAQALIKLTPRAAYLDGEIVVLGEDGVSSFAELQDALSRNQASRQLEGRARPDGPIAEAWPQKSSICLGPERVSSRRQLG
jgi:ATP-dependent DNA ligase